MELDVNGGHDEVAAGKHAGAALAVVLHPAGLVAQREPAATGELDLEDCSALYQPTVEQVPQAGAAAVELKDGATEIRYGFRQCLHSTQGSMARHAGHREELAGSLTIRCKHLRGLLHFP